MTNSAPALDPGAVLAALGIHDATTITPVTGGKDTAIWRVVHGGGVSALRVMRPTQTAAAEREIAAMRMAGAVGLPVPTVEQFAVWHGRPAMLLAWCRGETVGDALRRQPWRAYPLGIAFGQTQAAMHALPVPDALYDRDGQWISLAGDGEMPLQDRVRIGATAPPALLHLDYHPRNVMVENGIVTGVLDWTNVGVGDARADWARTLSILRLNGAVEARAARVAVVTVLRVFEAGWRRGYREQAGRRLAGLAPFYAWAGAAMAHDLAPRRGTPHGPPDAVYAAIARWTARWKRRAGIAPQ